MDRKPGKRRPKWFGRQRPSAPPASDTPNNPKNPPLGKMWQGEAQGRERTDSWLLREPPPPEKPLAPQTDRDSYPQLPPWPPSPKNDRLAAKRDGDDQHGGSSGAPSTEEHAAPPWGQPAARSDARQDGAREGRGGRLRALWANVSKVSKVSIVTKIATTFRRPRVALATVAVVLLLCLLFGAAALSAAFFNGLSTGSHGAPGAGNANGVVMSPTTGQATASVTTTTTPGTTQTPTTLTLAITCASGTATGKVQLCVHTLPGAALSLRVHYSIPKCHKAAFSSPGNADSGGNYTWSWSVSSACGSATAMVTASLAGQTVTQSTTFNL